MAVYADPRYLASLSEFGEPVRLPESGAGFLIQSIPGTERRDARGPYPLLSATRWEALPKELPQIEAGLVSVVAVADPLTAPPAALNQAFPDLCRPYKDHFIVRMRGRYEGPWPESHRRNLRSASSIEVQEVSASAQADGDWLRLYGDLCVRKGITGVAAFSKNALTSQLRLPSSALYQARHNGAIEGMALWLRDGDRAYYHLGAASEAGLAAGAMYALFDRALHDLAGQGIERVLLGAGAGTYGNASDGLTRFKSGWANESAPAYLCGRIFDPNTYREFAGGRDEAYFPAYRAAGASIGAG